MSSQLEQICDILRQCTRKKIPSDLEPKTDLQLELAIDSIGMFMLFDRLGEKFKLDPVDLSKRAKHIRTIEDLLMSISEIQQNA